MRTFILALLFSTAVFAFTTSEEDSGQLGSGARGPAFGSGAGFTEDGRGVIGSGT